jgi:hypothetical protein
LTSGCSLTFYNKASRIGEVFKSNPMSNLEIVKPVVQEGIEFYTSADGLLNGISQAGCARLCGVNEASIRGILGGLSDRGKTPTKGLQHLVEANMYLELTSNQQAKVLDSKVVASLVTYYAIEKRLEIATHSLAKFATIGINTWIRGVTGFTDPNNSVALLNSINATMGKMMVKLEKLERIEEETIGYRKATATMPVLEKWMQELSDTEAAKLIAPAEVTYTIKEAVAKLFPTVQFDQTMHRQLALKVGQTINGLTDKPVLKKDTPNSKGYPMTVNAYTPAQLPLIKLCLQTIICGY